MDIITDYDNALQALYDHVGFVEDWVICPVDFKVEMYWFLTETECRYAKTEDELLTGEGESYSDEIYTLRFYNKWVYEGEKYTMVFCDPHTDGMKWFRFFDNSKRVKNEKVLSVLE